MTVTIISIKHGKSQAETSSISAIKSAAIMIPAHHQMATGPTAKHQKHRNNISFSRQNIQTSYESVERYLLQHR